MRSAGEELTHLLKTAMPPQSPSGNKKARWRDIYIAHAREPLDNAAGISLYYHLTKAGYSVTLDREGVLIGNHQVSAANCIANSTDIILILTEAVLRRFAEAERLGNDRDRIHLVEEISTAMKLGKPIIPVLIPRDPDDPPAEVREWLQNVKLNGNIHCVVARTYEETVEELKKNLRCRPSYWRRWSRNICRFMIWIVLLILMGRYWGIHDPEPIIVVGLQPEPVMGVPSPSVPEPLFKQIAKAKSYESTGNAEGKQNALRIYRDAAAMIPRENRSSLDEKMLSEAVADDRAGHIDDALRKYSSVFTRWLQENEHER